MGQSWIWQCDRWEYTRNGNQREQGETFCKGNLTIKHSTQILARGIQSILDKYNTAEGCIPCKGDPKRKL